MRTRHPPSPHAPIAPRTPTLQADLVTTGVVDLLVALAGKPDASRQMVAAACRVLARFAAMPGPLQAAVANPATAAALWALLGPQQARPGASPDATPAPKAKPNAAKLGAELSDEVGRPPGSASAEGGSPSDPSSPTLLQAPKMRMHQPGPGRRAPCRAAGGLEGGNGGGAEVPGLCVCH